MIARAAAVALAVLALAAAADAAPAADPGVTVLLGGTVPLTGEAAAFGTAGPGAKAYFDYVNARGGVHGRKIEYRYHDSAEPTINGVFGRMQSSVVRKRR